MRNIAINFLQPKNHTNTGCGGLRALLFWRLGQGLVRGYINPYDQKIVAMDWQHALFLLLFFHQTNPMTYASDRNQDTGHPKTFNSTAKAL